MGADALATLVAGIIVSPGHQQPGPMVSTAQNQQSLVCQEEWFQLPMTSHFWEMIKNAIKFLDMNSALQRLSSFGATTIHIVLYLLSIWVILAIHHPCRYNHHLWPSSLCDKSPQKYIHHLNYCWLIISKVQWHSPEDNFTKDTWGQFHKRYLSHQSLKAWKLLI